MIVLYLNFHLLSRKSIPDQYSAISKRTISRSLNAGFDCNSPIEMAESILRFGPLSNVLIFVGSLINKSTPTEINKIEGITQYHDFEFHPGGVIARCQSSIGVGKKITLKPAKYTPEYKIDKSFQENIFTRQIDDSGNPKKRSSNNRYMSISQTDNFTDDTSDGFAQTSQAQFDEYDTVFPCPNEKCSLEFLTLGGKLCKKKEYVNPHTLCHFFHLQGYEAHLTDRSKCLERKWNEDIYSHVRKRFISKFGIAAKPSNYSDSRKIVTHISEVGEPIQMNQEMLQIEEGM